MGRRGYGPEPGARRPAYESDLMHFAVEGVGLYISLQPDFRSRVFFCPVSAGQIKNLRNFPSLARRAFISSHRLSLDGGGGLPSHLGERPAVGPVIFSRYPGAYLNRPLQLAMIAIDHTRP